MSEGVKASRITNYYSEYRYKKKLLRHQNKFFVLYFFASRTYILNVRNATQIFCALPSLFSSCSLLLFGKSSEQKVRFTQSYFAILEYLKDLSFLTNKNEACYATLSVAPCFSFFLWVPVLQLSLREFFYSHGN